MTFKKGALIAAFTAAAAAVLATAAFTITAGASPFAAIGMGFSLLNLGWVVHKKMKENSHDSAERPG